MTDHGWVIDSYMSPGSFLVMMSIVSAFIYLVCTLPTRMKKLRTAWLYYFKLVFIIFLDVLAIITLTGVNIGTDLMSNLTVGTVCVIINVFIYWTFNAGRKSEKQPISEKYYNIIWVGTHFITSLPLLLTMFASQHWVRERTIVQAVFIFLAVTANLTNSVKPNHFIGIRTPWTLADEDVWRKTHQACSKWFFISALVGFVLSIVVPVPWLHRLLYIIGLSTTAYAMIYSYWLHKKKASV
jgi:uncharacterized membrane protein